MQEFLFPPVLPKHVSVGCQHSSFAEVSKQTLHCLRGQWLRSLRRTPERPLHRRSAQHKQIVPGTHHETFQAAMRVLVSVCPGETWIKGSCAEHNVMAPSGSVKMNKISHSVES